MTSILEVTGREEGTTANWLTQGANELLLDKSESEVRGLMIRDLGLGL